MTLDQTMQMLNKSFAHDVVRTRYVPEYLYEIAKCGQGVIRPQVINGPVWLWMKLEDR